MNAYKRYKNRLERFLQTERGKRFINFAYSFGAAIVILGAMCKLLHFPFGNEMLFIGMVTECIVFILSAFDTPVRDYNWEQVFPALSTVDSDKNPGFNADLAQKVAAPQTAPSQTAPSQTAPSQTAPSQTAPQQTTLQQTSSPQQTPLDVARSTDPIPATSSIYAATSGGGQQIETQSLSAYTEEYGRQMENLNRTLSGLNSIYEIQLKSVSSQIGAIEQINRGLARLRNMYGEALPEGSVIKAETEKMAGQLKELNDVYARMLNAMTVHQNNKGDNPNI